jgi:hypothetical protein
MAELGQFNARLGGARGEFGAVDRDENVLEHEIPRWMPLTRQVDIVAARISNA